MGRPKGSRNKVKEIIFTGDINSAISDRISERESLSAEASALIEQIKDLKSNLSKKNRRIRVLEKEITKLEEMKADKESPKLLEEEESSLEKDDDSIVIEEEKE